MNQAKTIHLPINIEDLSCPICYKSYNQSSCQLISLSCGHNLCSYCVKQVQNCPFCKTRLTRNITYSKNILLSSMLELKDKQKECQLHSRPLELFCKDQNKPFCIECMIDNGVIPNNSIKFSAINSKAERLKANVGDINIRKEESRKKFVSLLQEQEKSLKRHLDEEFDKILEPIMKLKKKLRRDIDILVLTQEDRYDRENSLLQGMMSWKTEKEEILNQWSTTISPTGDLVKQLVEDPKDKIEEEELKNFQTKFDTSKNTFEHETDGVKNNILSIVDGINLPWETIGTQVGEAHIDPEIFEKREKKHLKESLEAHGLKACWKKDSGVQKLHINQGDLTTPSQKTLDHHFYSLLENLQVECFDLSQAGFQFFCSILQRSEKISNLIFINNENSDFDPAILTSALSPLKNLERLGLFLPAEEITQERFYNLWFALSNLSKLQKLKIITNYHSIQRDSESPFPEKTFGALITLKEIDLTFLKGELNQNDNLAYLWNTLQSSESLVKMKIVFDECYQSFKNALNTFIQNLPSLRHLEDLSIEFRKPQRLLEESHIISLSEAFNQLTSLKTLTLSITEQDKSFSNSLSQVLKGIDGQKLTQLKALRLSLSGNRFFNDEFLEKISSSLLQVTSLNKLMLELKYSHVSGEGICKFISNLSGLTLLEMLVIDCQNCSNINEDSKIKALEQLTALTTIKEKEIIFNAEQVANFAQRKIKIEDEQNSFDSYLQNEYYTQSTGGILQNNNGNNSDNDDDEDSDEDDDS